MRTQTKEIQENLTPTEALRILKEGNERFVENKLLHRDYSSQVEVTSAGQYPFAVILSCIDSRVPAEIIFDQGIGDIFSARVAGNVLNEDLLGSMEFGCKLAGSKLILVMGHSRCGAVNGACQHAELGSLTGLLKKIEPAVDQVISDPSAEVTPEILEDVAIQNVHNVIKEIREKSPILTEMEKSGEILIAGAMYYVEDGRVEFI